MMFPSWFAASVVLLNFSRCAQAAPQSRSNNAVEALPATLSRDVTSTTACNNSPLLCSRAYNNVTHLGAHDVAFLRDSSTGFSISGNQFYNATIALSAGVRLLQAQVHNKDGVLQLCHTTCSLLDGGSLQTWLSDIRYWMDTNVNEVVTIILVNSDNNSTASFGSVFANSGISKYGYTPTTAPGPMVGWPSLQSMITQNTRLVTFIASITYDVSFPYLLPEFNYAFETAFSVTSISSFTCTLDRPSSLTAATAITQGYLPVMNHMLQAVQAFGIQVPDIGNISTTNSPNTTTIGALGLHAQTCTSQWGVRPVFILVDFWNVGPSLQTADTLNGITPVGRKTVSQNLLTATSGADGMSPMGGAALALVILAGMTFVLL